MEQEMADVEAPQPNGSAGQQKRCAAAIFEKANRPVTLKVFFNYY